MVYGYVRVSTDRQDTENQKIGINDKAKFLHTQIDEWIADDGVSGAKEPDKRMLGGLLNKLKKGDIIIASEISRLGRKLFMVMRILEQCMLVEAKVYTVKDGYELGDNIQSKVLAFAFGLAAEIERDMIQKRTLEGLARRRAQGVILGRRVGSGSNIVALAGKEELVKKYLDAGLSFEQIARVLKVHRLTVSRLAEMRGWSSPTPFLGSQYKNKSRVDEYFPEGRKLELSRLVKEEPSAKKMVQYFNDKYGMQISQGMLIKYIKELKLYDTWVETNTRLRAIYNVDCGKNKR